MLMIMVDCVVFQVLILSKVSYVKKVSVREREKKSAVIVVEVVTTPLHILEG